MTPGSASQRSVKHGSILSGNFWTSRVSSQWKSTTVAGLEAKRADLVAYRARLEAETRKVTVDIDHLEAAIALFGTDADPDVIRGHAVKHRAKKGALKRFVLAKLREAGGPLTSEAITRAWCEDRGLRADGDTYVVIRKRVGSCLIAACGAGLVTREGMEGVWQRYALS